MIPITQIRWLLPVLLLAAVPLLGHKPKGAKTITITGNVVGTACYLGHNSQGEGHTDCAIQCAKAGVPLAILDSESKTLYLPLSGHHGANDKLIEHAEKTVRVTGKVIDKDGMKAISIESIEPVGGE